MLGKHKTILFKTQGIHTALRKSTDTFYQVIINFILSLFSNVSIYVHVNSNQLSAKNCLSVDGRKIAILVGLFTAYKTVSIKIE